MYIALNCYTQFNVKNINICKQHTSINNKFLVYIDQWRSLWWWMKSWVNYVRYMYGHIRLYNAHHVFRSFQYEHTQTLYYTARLAGSHKASRRTGRRNHPGIFWCSSSPLYQVGRLMQKKWKYFKYNVFL